MKFKNLILLSFLFVFGACANDAKQEGKDVAHDRSSHQQTDEEHEAEHEHSDVIELNQGQPWKVDDNMMTYIKKMNDEVDAFSGKSYNDYQVLAMDLMENIDGLTSNCTMTGKAHDELHKWLLPYIDTVNDFAKADNDIDAAKQFNEVKAAFKTFNQFFK